MNALVVYTPTKDWTILWSMLWSMLLSIVILIVWKPLDEMAKKFRMMEKLMDIAKSTDQELDKVTAELNEVNDELEKVVIDREEMKRETDKVNTLLLEALKLVYELDRKMVKFDAYQDAIETLCQTQQETLMQMDRNLCEVDTKEFKKIQALVYARQSDIDEVGTLVEQLKSRIVDNEVRVREVDHKVEKIEVALTMRQEEIDVVETSVQQLKGWFHKRIDIRRLRDAKTDIVYNTKDRARCLEEALKVRELDHTIGERMKTLNDYELDLCLNV